jgi:hypothetical protein
MARDHVIGLVQHVTGDGTLALVVARTPELPRRKVPTHSPARSPARQSPARQSKSIADHLALNTFKSSFQTSVKESFQAVEQAHSIELDTEQAYPDDLAGTLFAHVGAPPQWEQCFVTLERDRLSAHRGLDTAAKVVASLDVGRSFSSAATQRECQAVDTDPCGTFKVAQPGREPKCFKAATEAEMYMWIKHLTAASKRYR